MEINNVSSLAKNLGGIFSKNSSTILTGLAVTGVISTAIFAVKATPKALEILDSERYYREENWDGESDKSLTNKDVVQLTWRCYIPAAALGLATIGCVVYANKVSLRRNAALASLYSITDAAFKEYQTKVVQTIGRGKEQNVRDEIDADRVKKNPPGSNQVVFTGKGEVMCYDPFTGRYFKGDIEHIRKTVNELNRRLMTDMFIDLNDLYYELGVASVKLGDSLGWRAEDGLVEMRFTSQLTDEGTPCLVLNYDVYPK